MVRAFGAYGERVTEPGEPALLEFITSREVAVSKFK
jgi:hypothetical protein